MPRGKGPRSSEIREAVDEALSKGKETYNEIVEYTGLYYNTVYCHLKKRGIKLTKKSKPIKKLLSREQTFTQKRLSPIQYWRRNIGKLRAPCAYPTSRSLNTKLMGWEIKGVIPQPHQGPPAKIRVEISRGVRGSTGILYAGSGRILLEDSFVNAKKYRCLESNGKHVIELQYQTEYLDVVREEKKDLETFLGLAEADSGLELCVFMKGEFPSIIIRGAKDPVVDKK